MGQPSYAMETEIRQVGSAKGASTLEQGITFFLVFAFASGALAHIWPAIRPITPLVTEPFQVLSNGAVLFAIYRRQQDSRLWSWLLIASIVKVKM
ncbi:MAG: hypothetical protein AAFU67_18925 [Bacteroidota bacterium]